MISPASNFRIYLASEPVDFRKGMDGLAACVANNFELDPYSGAIYVFRSRRTYPLKILVWDGSGLALIMKRLNGKRFTWPVTLSKVQFDALFEGIDWTQVAASSSRKPIFL